MTKYSNHARSRMVERGISVAEVEEALLKGAKELQAPNKILYHFRYFIVVTKVLEKEHYVITVKPRW